MESLNQTYQVLYIDTSYFSFKILINHISKEEQIHRSYFSSLYSRMYILSYLLYFVAQFSKSATLFDFRVSIAKNRKEGKTERERERERERVRRGKAVGKLVGRRRVNGSVVMGVGGGVE